MKRPFALVGFTYFIALVAAVYFGKNIALIFAIAFFVGFIISLFFKNMRSTKIIPIAFIVAAIAFSTYYISYTVKVEPNKMLDKKDATITGTICDAPYKSYNRYYYTVKTTNISLTEGTDGTPQNVKMRISSPKALDADVYDQISTNVYLFLPIDDDGFSSKTYYQSKGIYVLGYVSDYENVQTESTSQKPIYYYIIKLKQKLIHNIKMVLPQKQSSVISGVLFGDKASINADIKDDFRNIGISHLLAVSGLHLTIICQFLMLLFVTLKIPQKYSSMLSIVAVVFFMALTGFSSSIMRASIMTIIYLISLMVNKKSDSISSLAVAVALLCIINPFAAGDIGLLLSCGSTLGIILLNSPIENIVFKRIGFKKKNNKIIFTVVNAITLSISASIFTLPIIMISFSYISLIAPIANLLIVVPSSIMMISALLFEVFSFIDILGFLTYPAALISGAIATYTTWCAKILSKIPFVSVPASQPFLLICLCGILLILAVAIYFKIDLHLAKIVFLLSTIILLTGIFSYQLSVRNITRLSVLDTGNGLCAVLNKNNHAAVISCGGEKMYTTEAINYLKDNNISKLDYILLSDSNDKNCYYSKQLIQKYSPFAVVMSSSEKLLEKTGNNFNSCGRVTYFNKKVDTDIWENVNIKSESEENKSITFVTINDIKILLCPENIDFNNIPEEFKNCDILITSGEISNYSNYLPSYTVLAMNADTANKKAKNLILGGNNLLATAGNGNINIDFIKDKNISIRRAI